jgi:tripartite-type tricarboxylate transporter receptor subunit TctC
MPDLPTLAEAGVPGYEFNAWFLIVAPAKTPADIIAKLNREVAAMNEDSQAKERLANLGAEPAAALAPNDVSAFIGREVQRWAKVVKDGNIKVD